MDRNLFRRKPSALSAWLEDAPTRSTTTNKSTPIPAVVDAAAAHDFLDGEKIGDQNRMGHWKRRVSSRLVIFGGIGIVALVGVVGSFITSQKRPPERPESASRTVGAPSGSLQVIGEPEAGDLAQTTQNQAALPGVVRKPANFRGTELTITSQNIPDNYKTDPQAFDKFVASMKANTKIQTGKWGTVYMLDAPRSQFLTYRTSNRLVFINSPAKFSAADWKAYLERLELN
jgi:hypothetical protein